MKPRIANVLFHSLLAFIGAGLGAVETTQFASPDEAKAYYHVACPLAPRPPELAASGRDKPDFREAEGFETLDNWTLRSGDAPVELRRSEVCRVFGNYAAELAISEAKSCNFALIPDTPLALKDEENGVLLWARFLQYNYMGGPILGYGVELTDAKGKVHRLRFPNYVLTFQMWSPILLRLPDASAAMPRPWKLTALTVAFNPRQRVQPPYFLLLDSLQFFHDDLDYPADVPPLKLPEPANADSTLPVCRDKVETAVEAKGRGAVFTARDGKETIRYVVTPRNGDLNDLEVEFNGRRLHPFADGGPVFELEKEMLKAGSPQLKIECKAARLNPDGTLVASFQARSNVGGDGYTDELADFTLSYRLHGKSLILDLAEKDGKMAEFNFGPGGTEGVKYVRVPYLRIDPEGPRVGIGSDFYFTALADQFVSDGTTLFGVRDNVNGGVRYGKLTNGKRNPARERFIITFSGDFDETLPTLPNPVSPYIEKYAAASWRWGMNDLSWVRQLYHQGVRDFQFRSHAEQHRDLDESYGYNYGFAPSKGPDYLRRISQSFQEVGFGFAPYNAYTELNPFTREFSIRALRRDSDGQFINYHQTPAAAQRAQELAAPEYVKRYSPTFSYLDVHGCREPWRWPDMRAKSFMAGKFRAEFLGNAALMQRNREIFGGPVFTEGGCNWIYAGFYDVIYGYFGHGLNYRELDDIVDFSLLKIKPHAIQAGMGDYAMYFRGNPPADEDEALRRFVTSTLSYGNAAWLDGNARPRIYFLTNAVQRNFLGVNPISIEYSDGTKLMPASEAFHTDALGKSFIKVTYANGLTLFANLNKAGESWTVENRTIPSPGFFARKADGTVEAYSLDNDFVRSPEYCYGKVRKFSLALDGFALEKGGAAIRPDGDRGFLVYPEGGFTNLAVTPAKLGLAAAKRYTLTFRDRDGKELGKATLDAPDGVFKLAAPKPGVACIEAAAMR